MNPGTAVQVTEDILGPRHTFIPRGTIGILTWYDARKNIGNAQFVGIVGQHIVHEYQMKVVTLLTS